MASRRLRAFKRWMNSHGVQWSTDALEFIDTPEEGISVKALRDLKDGEVVSTIPKSACLTMKNTGACDIIQSAGLSGCLGLSVAIMYEMSLGEESPWAAYLQLLPEKECLPLVWTVDEIDHFLRGTELHKIVKEDKFLMYADWEESILPLLDTGDLDPKFFGLEQYFAARSLIASRSFQIDDDHGSGMVPLADLFNHKTGAEDVHFTCGSSDSESDDDDDDNSKPGDDDDDNSNPGDDDDDNSNPGDDDDDNSNPDKSYTANYVDEEPANTLERTSDDPKVLEMIMVKNVKAGVEVFNTYGSAGNAALLHRYGFTEPDNPYDIVNIDLDLVLEWCTSMFSSRHSRARLSLWRKLDYSGCFSESTEYFEISFNGDPQVELLILLYIMLLPDDDYCKLDLAVSTATDHKEMISMISSEKFNFRFDKGTEIDKSLLLTESVCNALLRLAEKRENLYGLSSIENDIEALEKCSEKERKLYHSLMLRVSERRILEKFRTYASLGAKIVQYLHNII
ncbi:ribosomal lysine N-methyltransferase 3 [Euphorbia lathyris]|uniref:ribosomal lysine N-methyltransferase 3 n=1 Tax=Euphorbia lathyris TaxID=212925 RepID=UPI003313AAA3